ncbi:armadillo-type protein [Crassisporium funariophilum]|nr:armadillo-type protein [Crassisporium funariophilum]
MPRENRKRGKKHKKQPQEEEPKAQEYAEPKTIPEGAPSWIVPASKTEEEVNLEAPFGYVDVDVKAYFRTVDVQIRDWQEHQEERTVDEGESDPNEQKRLFFVAALTEMHGKEKQLATDPDCSVILERMSYSMDDFVRRVFVDSLTGSYEALVRHRFASHVCQTLFTVARDTVSRETKGVMPTVPDSPDKGELRSLKQLILDICEELLPSVTSHIMDPFASHVIRSLLLLLSPNLAASEDSSQSAVRSKRSAAWKSKQGQMKSVFKDEKGKGKETVMRAIPPEFRQMARRFVEVFRSQNGENEVRAMAASKVACPGLQMLLEVEADQNMSNEPGSLMDRVMVGIITACSKDASAAIEESDYLGTLLRDSNSSRLLEIISSRCPEDAFITLWNVYFKGKLGRLAVHPVANFVFAKAVERTSEAQLLNACEELENTWNKLIRTSRTGVLRAIIDRASVFKSIGPSISKILYLAFDLTTPEDRAFTVPCVLTLLPLHDYKAAVASRSTQDKPPPTHHGRPELSASDPLEPKIQGSILLQSLLRLSEPHNQFVLDSILSLPIEERLMIAHHASGSRVYDVLLESDTVPAKMKRQFVMDFIGHYDVLVDDKLGSRVGDRCWAFCDTYLKEKIARSLVTKEQVLAASYYGKFFARNLNLYLLQRRPEEWRNLQSERKRSQEEKPAAALIPSTTEIHHEQAPSTDKRKRKSRPEDEIDALFNAKLGKRIRKAALAETIPVSQSPVKVEAVKEDKGTKDKSLQQVLGAIRSAPKDEAHMKKSKKS